MRLLRLLISSFFLLISLSAWSGNIYIVRHGNAENNVQSIFNSRLESPPAHLTSTGKQEAQALALELKKYVNNTAMIYFSPLARTRETAHIISAELGLDNNLHEDLALIEVDHGTLENKSYKEATKFGDDPWDISRADLFDGETQDRLQMRVILFLQRVLESSEANSDIIIVTHGNPARYLLKYLDPIKYPDRRLLNCEFQVIERST